MIALIQRVTSSSVSVSDQIISSIDKGLMALIGVENNDNEAVCERLAEKITAYRIFSDGDGKMNLSVKDSGGSILLVPQFTLVADTRKGLRPSFSHAAAPELGRRMFELLSSEIKKNEVNVETGEFGADMQVALVNDGPVTFWLQVT